MYQVILLNDGEKNYYYSYIESVDTALGNVSLDTLPPYQDILKARSCYLDGNEWVFDEDKYNELLEIKRQEEEERESEEAKLEAALSNEEIAEALMELADMMVAIDERLTVLEGV